MKNYDITIIGAGSAGLVAAATACGLGAKVLLIENRKMGGDCLNYGCVPSKTFLKSCHIMKDIKNAEKYGINITSSEVSLEKVMQRVKSIIAEIAPHDSVERFTSLGADVILDKAEILSNNSVKVGDTIYSTRKIIISTGSTAAIPPINGLEEVDYYTNETIFDLTTLPKKMIVLGAGPIGLELGQGFCNLGSEVHIIDRSNSLFSKDEPEVSPIMTKALTDDGVILHLNSKILSVKKLGDETILQIEENGQLNEYSCDVLMIALGRKPNTQNLGLENVGVQLNERGYIIVNDKLQTTVKDIYACGDVRGKYQFTHTASYEASVAVKNALISPTFKTCYKNIAWTTYTSPEVAHVGYLHSEVPDAQTLFIDISENDRAKAEDDRRGFVKIILDDKRHVIGATIVGAKAGEMIPQLSILITNDMPLSSVMNVIYQYPIQGEIIKSLALADFKQHVKPWQQSLMKKIVHKGEKDD